MTTTETAQDTMQRTELTSKEGRKFLRSVIRHNEKHGWDEEWRACVSPETDWHWEFRRTVKGELGEPDRYITVITDSACRLPRDRDTGECQAFSDAKPVFVPPPRGANLGGINTCILAKLLLEGGEARLNGSAGSVSSSEHGLAWLSLDVTMPSAGQYATVCLDSTICKDGRAVASSDIRV